MLCTSPLRKALCIKTDYHMKRINKLNAIGILLLSLCACTQTTTGIWNEPTYNENINHFLIDPNNSSLIVIGGEYHYIFSKDSAPLPILAWEGRKLLRADFSSAFEVDEKNRITGEYSVICTCESASQEELHWLETNGFGRIESGFYSKTYNIKGNRYSSGTAKFPSPHQLNNNYSIKVRAPHSASGVMGRAALTPIAIAEDGVATIGVGALLIIAAPFVAADKISDLNGAK